MPFSPNDAQRHIKNIAKGSESKWARIANSVLEKTGDEGKAIRIANAAVGSGTKRARR